VLIFFFLAGQKKTPGVAWGLNLYPVKR
jgi:hypothetical protein